MRTSIFKSIILKMESLHETITEKVETDTDYSWRRSHRFPTGVQKYPHERKIMMLHTSEVCKINTLTETDLKTQSRNIPSLWFVCLPLIRIRFD